MNLKTIPETKAENETENYLNTMKYRLKTKLKPRLEKRLERKRDCAVRLVTYSVDLCPSSLRRLPSPKNWRGKEPRMWPQEIR